MNKGVCRAVVLWLFMLSALALLPGCGKKGPLYLPPAATPAPATVPTELQNPAESQNPAEPQAPGPAGQTQP